MLCIHRLGFGEATPSAMHIQVACLSQDRFQEKGLYLSSFIGYLLAAKEIRVGTEGGASFGGRKLQHPEWRLFCC